MNQLHSPFFIEATEDNIYQKLTEHGIYGHDKLPVPYIGVSKDQRIWEMYRHSQRGKKGWMIHDSLKRIKKEYLSKYIPNEA